jgi:5'-methylthioadenosine/S-adenosylhomocysteine nucleosidase
MNERRWHRPPIVILTALDVEYLAVRERLAGIRRPAPVSGTRFEIGSLPDGGDVVLARTGPGNHASAVIAERAISTFAPVAVLFVGVAGALNRGLELGDVVVATQVYAYHGAAARTGGLRSRPRVWEIDHRIDQAAHQIAWSLAGAGAPRVRFGPVASGEVLHDARVSEPLRWLREHYDDALAIEMEAAGVAKAGQLSAAPVAVIRAISDRADGTKAGTDGQQWQAKAVRNAALFATALAADLIAEHPPREDRAREDRAREDRAREDRAGAEREQPMPDVHVSTHGGSHGAVAGVINGGVHNDMRRDGPGAGGGSW